MNMICRVHFNPLKSLKRKLYYKILVEQTVRYLKRKDASCCQQQQTQQHLLGFTTRSSRSSSSGSAPNSSSRSTGLTQVEMSLKDCLKQILKSLEADFQYGFEKFKCSTKVLVMLILEHNLPVLLLNAMENLEPEDDITSLCVKILFVLFTNGYSELNRLVSLYLAIYSNELVKPLARLYYTEEHASSIGYILRELLRNRDSTFLSKCLADITFLQGICNYNLASSNKEVIREAYDTLKVLLLVADDDRKECTTSPIEQVAIVTKFLETNAVQVLDLVNTTLTKGSSHCKTLVLKLLAKILFEKRNFGLRKTYVNNVESLCSLLAVCDAKITKSNGSAKSSAFQIVKLFIANPNKSRKVELKVYEKRELLYRLVQDDRHPNDYCAEEQLELLQSLDQINRPIATC